jgi:hypothetical protein
MPTQLLERTSVLDVSMPPNKPLQDEPDAPDAPEEDEEEEPT